MQASPSETVKADTSPYHASRLSLTRSRSRSLARPPALISWVADQRRDVGVG